MKKLQLKKVLLVCGGAKSSRMSFLGRLRSEWRKVDMGGSRKAKNELTSFVHGPLFEYKTGQVKKIDRLYFDISAGQAMKQMDLWCFTSFAHIFFAQIHICLTNKEARIHLWRAVRNNRPEPHPQACG